MPRQLTDDTIWDYYHAALPVGQQDDWPRCTALHSYDFPITTFSTCWFVKNPATPPTVGTRPAPGSYVQAPQLGHWLIDSGASNHFTTMCHLLSDSRNCADEKILTHNGYIVAKGIGHVTLHTSVGIHTIHNVFFVPALARRHNLLSIPQIVLKGCTVTMSRSSCKVFSDAVPPILFLEGSFTGHGFLIDILTCHTTTQNAKLDLNGSVLLPTHLYDEGRLATFSATGLDHLAIITGSSDIQPIEI